METKKLQNVKIKNIIDMKDENKKLGQEPAFPCEVGFLDGEIRQQHQNGNYTALDNGMSKRFYAACAAMQGFCANPNASKQSDGTTHTYKSLSETAFLIADALLLTEQENNE